MKQWALRITAYADRLLTGLDQIDWPNSIKEQQKNWIGKSSGLNIIFKTENNLNISVFTTRPETIYGVTFLVLSPEHEHLSQLCTEGQKRKNKKLSNRMFEKN